MLERFSRKMKRHQGLTGISRTEGGTALAHVVKQGPSKPRVTVCEFLSGTMSAGQSALRECLRRYDLISSPAACSLEFGSYQLLQVAPPNVPDSEMREALGWQIHDLIDIPLEESVIDFFHILRSHQREGARTTYVIVAHKDLVQRQAAMMKNAALKIQAIDIPELVLRNLVNLHPDAERGVAFLYFGSDSGLIIIVRGQELCLARNLPLGLDRLNEGADNVEQVVEIIALEIQRSLDFHERSFAQTAIDSLLLAPQQYDADMLLTGLRSGLGIQVDVLDLAEILEWPETLAENPERCLLAIGAALRSSKEGA